MNAMISVFPIPALGLILRSLPSDLVPCFTDAKQLFGSRKQAFLMLAEEVTSMAAFLSVSVLGVASVSQPVSFTCPQDQAFSRGGIAQPGPGAGHPFVSPGNPRF